MLKRDTKTDQIISYTADANKLNRGKVNLPILDGRFLKDEFSRIIDITFKSIPEAVNAERVVMEKISIAQSEMLSGLVDMPSSVVIPDAIRNNADALEQFTKDIAKKQFLTSLDNLIDDGDNTVSGLTKQIDQLTAEIENKDKIISDQLDAIANFDDVLSTISNERALAIAENQSLQDAIISTQEIIDEQNSMIQDLMEQQMEESMRSFEDAQLTTVLALSQILSSSNSNT